MKRSICYLNGRYVDAAKATISARDRGFLFGEGLFETWRTYKGHPFALREHLARMAKSARALSIPFDERLPPCDEASEIPLPLRGDRSRVEGHPHRKG